MIVAGLLRSDRFTLFTIAVPTFWSAPGITELGEFVILMPYSRVSPSSVMAS